MLQNDFSPNEVDFYLALLTLGQANAAEVARNIDMDKASAYRAAEELEQKGLINRDGKHYDQKVFIGNPQALSELFQRRSEKLANQAEIIEDFVKDLPVLSSSEWLRSKIKVYEGEDAIFKLVEDRFSQKVPFTREIENSIKEGPALRPSKEYWIKHINKRLRSNLAVKILIDSKRVADEYNRTDKKQLKEVRRMPGKSVFTSGVTIYGSKVSFYNTRSMHPLGIIIEDRSIAELMAGIFDFAWENSKVV